MPLPLLLTPTADVGIVYSYDQFGNRIVDLLLTPAQDMRLVQGMPRLLQDLMKAILVAKGQDPLRPDFGFALWGDLGQPYALDSHYYVQEVYQFQDEFIALQADQAAQGFLALDEQLDHFETVTVLPHPESFTLVLDLTVFSRAGQTSPFAARIG